MQEQNESQSLAVVPGSIHGVFTNSDLFVHAQRVAGCIVESTMVPEYYRGKANIGNAVIAIDIAWRLQLPPLMVMQHLYVVYGKPAWSGQMVIALVNNSRRFAEPLEFEFKGERGQDAWGARAWTTTKDGKRINGPWVDIALAKAEGWYGKKDSKWQSMPEMMLRYRSAAYFGRTVCPDVTIGLRTVEEEMELPTGPTIEVRTEKPDFGPAASAVLPAPAPVAPRTRRVKAATAAPAPAPAEPAATAAAAPPAREVETLGDPPAPPAARPAPVEKTIEMLALELSTKLATAHVDHNDFYDWLESSGRGQVFRFDPRTIENATQLPRALLEALLEEGSPHLAACIRVHSTNSK